MENTQRIVGYEIFAVSASSNQTKTPAIVRSIISKQEAQEQIDLFVNDLIKTTGISDWIGHYKLLENAEEIEEENVDNP